MKKNIFRLSLVFLIITTFISCASTKNIENSDLDGSSYEKAIKVKNIEQEYEYLKKICTNCKLLEQRLTEYNNKPYDVIKLKKINGEIVEYYFDISKFYGKKSFRRF